MVRTQVRERGRWSGQRPPTVRSPSRHSPMRVSRPRTLSPRRLKLLSDRLAVFQPRSAPPSRSNRQAVRENCGTTSVGRRWGDGEPTEAAPHLSPAFSSFAKAPRLTRIARRCVAGYGPGPECRGQSSHPTRAECHMGLSSLGPRRHSRRSARRARGRTLRDPGAYFALRGPFALGIRSRRRTKLPWPRGRGEQARPG